MHSHQPVLADLLAKVWIVFPPPALRHSERSFLALASFQSHPSEENMSDSTQWSQCEAAE